MASSTRVFKPKFNNNKSFVSYCPEWNMFVYANQKSAPKFCSHSKFLGGVRCLKTGDELKSDIVADRKKMRSLYKANNPFVPSYFRPKNSNEISR